MYPMENDIEINEEQELAADLYAKYDYEDNCGKEMAEYEN